MKKTLYFILLLVLVILIGVIYLSYNGVKTDKFNEIVKNQLKEKNSKIEIEINEIKLKLQPFDLLINLETKNPKINFGQNKISLEKISTNYNIISFFKKEFGINYIDIETKNNKIKQLIELLRQNQDSPQLYITDKAIKDGEIDLNMKFFFDEDGKMKKNFKIFGRIKNLLVKFLKNKEIENINFDFNYTYKDLNLENINLDYQDIKITSKKISIKEKKKFYAFKGNFQTEKSKLPKDISIIILNNKNINNVVLSSENDFSFNLNRKIKFSDILFESKIKLEEGSINLENEYLINYIPVFKNKLKFIDHIINIKYKDKIYINGKGKIEIEDKNDEIKYNLEFNKENINYNLNLSLDSIPIKLDIINFAKKENDKYKLIFKGNRTKNKFKISKFLLKNNKSELIDNNLELNKKYKIIDFEKIKLNYFNVKDIKNDLVISKNKNLYEIKSKNFNLSKIIDDILFNDSKKKTNFFDDNDKTFNVNFNQNYIDKSHYLINTKGKFKIRKNEIIELDLKANFANLKNISLSVKTKNNNKITTFYSDLAKPFVKKYKFIKGFEGGKLDFSSIKKNNISESKLKIYNFKLKELPALTKILTLASLQGISDILSGDGVTFDDFEMSFKNKKDLMEINEIYSIGPAISILMEGYVQSSELVSLKGTLVPATTINKFVGSIPILGDILVGKKTGEGVFGVSFKIKGSPKDLKTTVNPIKTLTPRFITRTLEKIKKTN